MESITRNIYQDDIINVIKVLKSNNLTQGPIIVTDEFDKFASYVGLRYLLWLN